MRAEPHTPPLAVQEIGATTERKWLLAGYLFIALFFFSRLAYIAAGRIELSEDEAYQWVWSKHLDFSYYSKPPLIAYLQFLGTAMWGDTEFGVRFFSPVLASLLSLFLLRFIAAEANARVAFWLIVMLAATPMLALGSTLLTVDSPSVFFWVASMITGWRAMQSGRLSTWCWTGVLTGLGLLSKYTAVVQVLSWLVFFALWKPARVHLRRPGPYLGLGVALLAFLPVLWWNYRHDWVTLGHLGDRGGLTEPWHFRPKFLGEFLGSEIGLLNPVFFVGTVWACIGSWRTEKRSPLLLFLFSMGAPLFILYLLLTLRSRVLPNWIVPSVVPLFALAMVFWGEECKNRPRLVRAWFKTGLALGFIVIGLLHGTEVIGWVMGRPIPPKLDPLHRVRGWSEIAQMFERERQQVLAEGKPAFLIAQHYGLTSILTFYSPELKKHVLTEPLVYCLRKEHPENQFYFWPGYGHRKGQNAIYIEEVTERLPPPAELKLQFESVTDLGLREVNYNGKVFRRYQLYLCRSLVAAGEVNASVTPRNGLP
jgi:4-amino-4-deoxy-L-arabinose transferase-like glycosyltransferase